MLNKQKILITGAGGFIGRHLCKYFTEANYDVIALVNLNTDVLGISARRTFTLQLPDADFNRLINLEKPDYLLHCAGTSSVAESFRHPEDDYTNNVVVTRFILNALKDYSNKTKLVFFSSAAVYGNQDKFPIDSESPAQPISPYGYHKLLCEMLCQQYWKLFNIQTSILRIFSVYGPGLKKQILWDMYNKALRSDVILLDGTGEEVRDFIYIHDLVKIVYEIIIKPGFNANIINVGTGRSVTIENLARLFMEVSGTASAIQFSGESRRGDPASWYLQFDGFMSQLTIPWMELKSGITNYLEWLKHDTS